MTTKSPKNRKATGQDNDQPNPKLLNEEIQLAVSGIWPTRNMKAKKARSRKRSRSLWSWGAAVFGPVAVLLLAASATGAVVGRVGLACVVAETLLLALLLCLGLSSPASCTLVSLQKSYSNNRHSPLGWIKWLLVPPGVVVVLASIFSLNERCAATIATVLVIGLPAVTWVMIRLGLAKSHIEWVYSRGKAEELKRRAWLTAAGLVAPTEVEAEYDVQYIHDRIPAPPLPFATVTEMPFYRVIYGSGCPPPGVSPTDAKGFWDDYRAKRVDLQITFFSNRALQMKKMDERYEVIALFALSLAVGLAGAHLCDLIGGHVNHALKWLTTLHIVLVPIGASALLLRSIDSANHLSLSYDEHRKVLTDMMTRYDEEDQQNEGSLETADLHTRVAAVEAVLLQELVCWWLAVSSEEVRPV